MIYRYTLLTGCAWALAILAACTTLETDDPQQLLETDRRFANLARQAGYRDAFVIFADSNAILLRNERPPIVGKEAIKEAYSYENVGYDIFWQPLEADVSGNLGYTYGTYQRQTQDSTGTPVTRVGYYTTVWKKQPNGEWKFVLDSGTTPGTREIYGIHEE